MEKKKSAKKEKSEGNFSYTLTMSSAQCHAVCESVEFLMRLRMAQSDEIPRHVLEWGEGLSVDEWCRRRDEAGPLLNAAFRILFPSWTEAKRDNRLYDLYQVTRKAIHDAEHPETTGVDSYPLRETAGEPMAKCEWSITGTKDPVMKDIRAGRGLKPIGRMGIE